MGVEDATEAPAGEAQLNEVRRALLAPQVAGGVQHELNNLLARVICIAENIQDETDLGLIHEHAESLIVAAARGAELMRRYMASAANGATDAPAVDMGSIP